MMLIDLLIILAVGVLGIAFAGIILSGMALTVISLFGFVKSLIVSFFTLA